MPLFFCSPVLVFAPGKWSLSSSKTSIGGLAKSSFEARECFSIACPSLQMQAKPWPPTCVEIALPARHAGCLHARRHRVGALLPAGHLEESFAARSTARTYTLISREPTYCVTAWRLRCFALGRQWAKAQRYFGTGGSSLRTAWTRWGQGSGATDVNLGGQCRGADGLVQEKLCDV